MENPNLRHACGHFIAPGTAMITPSCKKCQKQYNDAFDACIKDSFHAEKLTLEDSAALDAAIDFPMISGGLSAEDNIDGEEEADEEPHQNGVTYNRKPSGSPFTGINPPPFRPSKACRRKKLLRDRCLSFMGSIENMCDTFIKKISDSIKPLAGLSQYIRQQQDSGSSSLLEGSDSDDSWCEEFYPLRTVGNSVRDSVDVHPLT